MGRIEIEGGRRLDGELRVQGSKNSVLPILAATVLTREPCVIHNCPRLRDVESAIHILEHLGCRVHREEGTIQVDASGVDRWDIPLELMREMRSSVIFLGAILSRCGQAAMSYPGGCELGARPVDLHLEGLRRLGAEIGDQYGELEGKAPQLKGARIQLAFPSVGATENLMLAAACSQGTTVVANSAKEPEIIDLQEMLNGMGAKIKGAGSGTIVIEGVEKLHGVEYTVLPDRIVAATYLTAAAITGGRVRLTHVVPEHVEGVTAVLEESGCSIRRGKDTLELARKGEIRPIRAVQTMPYPGFPTDAQSILMSYLTLAKGTSVFVENIFESRYKQVGELLLMGADIRVMGRMAVVYGVEGLKGARVRCTDLRGGAALAVAALAAEGTSRIDCVEHIDRGYEDLEGCLTRLGGCARRVE
ncbi:MAG: UDP-N-acetylglucosamine 1-carboxyvinyltransferase [Eubacteriales bacterium]